MELGSKMLNGFGFGFVLLAVVETNEIHISIIYQRKSSLIRKSTAKLDWFAADLSDRYLHGRPGAPTTLMSDVQLSSR